MQGYIERIIKSGLSNGLTLEQIASEPNLAAKAYLEMRLKSIDKSGKQILNNEKG